jgi:transcriptional regulator with XRE-family HTH domain
MTASQYRAAFQRLGLSQAKAAELLGISIRTSHGYANGQTIPKAIAALVRALDAGKVTLDDL